MPHGDYATKTEDSMALSESYSYQTYEREQQKEVLFSKPKAAQRHRTFIDRSLSVSESTPIHEEKSASSTKTTSGTPNKRKVVLMVACLYLHVAGFGLVVVFGVIYVELIDAFNALRADVALIQSVYMGVTLGGGVLFTKVLQKHNPGKCVVIASFIGTASMAGAAFGTNVATLVVLIGVILGIAMACILLSTYVAISRVFTTNRKFALAILTLGATFGQIIIPFVTYALIDAYDWSGAVLILSGLLTLNCVPCGLIMAYTIGEHMENSARQTQSMSTKKHMFKDPLFYFYVLSYLVFLTFGPVEQWFAVDLAVLKGMTFEQGSTLLSINGGAGLGGRLLGTLMVKLFKDLRPEFYMMAGFTAWSVAHYTVSISPEYWMMALAMILIGVSAGLVVAARASMQIELNGVDNFPTTVAVCNFVGGAGEILGGYIGGYTVDITGNYDLIFLISTMSSVACAASFIVVYVVLRKRRQTYVVGQYSVLK